MKEVVSLVSKKEIRSPIKKKNILDNFKLAREERMKDVSKIYYNEEITDSRVRGILMKLDFNVIDKTKKV